MLVSSIGLKGFALATSAVAHVAFAVAAIAGSGHGPVAIDARAVAGDDTVLVEIADEPLEQAAAPEAPEPRAAEASTRPAAAPVRIAAASHTHPYPVQPDHEAHPHAPELAHAPAAPPEAASADPYRAAEVAHHEHEHEHEARPASAPVGSPIRIVVRGGTGPDVPNGSGGNGTAPSGPRVGVAPGEIVPASRVSVAARPLSTVRPAYPADAKAEGIEGDVLVEIVVDTAGSVIAARVAKGAGYGFDAAALDAIRRFRFSAAQLEGAPVRVRMVWPVQFRLN